MTNVFDGPVSQWMVSPVFTIRDDAPLQEAAARFDELKVSALPVLDPSGRLTGIITRADLTLAGRFVRESRDQQRHLRLPDGRVREFNHNRVPVVRRDLTVGACARRMLRQNDHRLYVAEDGPLEGVVSTREMMAAVSQSRVETPLDTILTRSVSVITSDSLLAATTSRLRADPSLTLVVTKDGAPVGVFSTFETTIAREADPEDPVELWMDASVLSLPARTPLYQAAGRAYEMRCRYIVALEGVAVTGLTSGMGFAQAIGARD